MSRTKIIEMSLASYIDWVDFRSLTYIKTAENYIFNAMGNLYNYINYTYIAILFMCSVL